MIISLRWFFTLGVLMAVFTVAEGVVADTTAGLPTITFKQAIYFPTLSGEDAKMEPGTYQVEAVPKGLKLIPIGEKAEAAIVIQATPRPHGQTLEAPQVETATVEEVYRLVLLLPDHQGWDAVGSLSGVRTRGGSYNVVYGTALPPTNTGSYNTGMGYGALKSNVGGSGNTAVGAVALSANNGGNENTAVGLNALRSNTSSHNTAIGKSALYSNTTGSHNTALGQDALYANTTGDSNTSVGRSALRNNTKGAFNTAIGFNALSSNTEGNANIAIGAGALNFNGRGGSNVAVGSAALGLNTDGGSNVAIGWGAIPKHTSSKRNTALGWNPLNELRKGEGNTAIGYIAGSALTEGDSNLYIENIGASTESNTIRIGSGGGRHTRTFIAGITGTPVAGASVVINAQGQLGVQGSSYHFKDDIQDMGESSQGLFHLRPVTFRYKSELAGKDAPREYGLIAEEVAKVYPELVGHDADGKIVTVKYHELIPMLLNEMQRLNRRVTELESRQVE